MQQLGPDDQTGVGDALPLHEAPTINYARAEKKVTTFDVNIRIIIFFMYTTGEHDIVYSCCLYY